MCAGISLLQTLCQKGVHLGTTDPAHIVSNCGTIELIWINGDIFIIRKAWFKMFNKSVCVVVQVYLHLRPWSSKTRPRQPIQIQVQSHNRTTIYNTVQTDCLKFPPVLLSRVVVSHHHHLHHDDNDDASDREVTCVSSLPVSPSPGSSVTNSACTSPQPSPTQSLLPHQFASLWPSGLSTWRSGSYLASSFSSAPF